VGAVDDHEVIVVDDGSTDRSLDIPVEFSIWYEEA
jgi:GT2 family glycosyltransferase